MELAEKLTLVRDLLTKVKTYIDSSEFYPTIRQYRGLIALGTISKALTLGRAIATLVEAGFPEEAFGLSRSLVELALIIRYISNKDVEQRATRYARFFAKDHEGWTKVIQKHYPLNKIEDTEYHEQMLEEAKTYPNPHQWTGLGDQTKQMALEADTFEVDVNSKPINYEFDYEAIYKWTSHYVHGTVIALEAHLTEPREPFRINARPNLPQRKAELALFNVLQYVAKICVHAFRILKDEGCNDILEEMRHAMQNF
jgi:hypothetical protein